MTSRQPWTASRTLWTRLEPRTRDTNLDRVLRAEVHDPAWMLCRQWQVGEFQGEDAGSPVDAELAYERDHMSRFRLGDAPDIERGPPDPQRPVFGGDEPSIDEEISQLNDVIEELDDHRDEQAQGGSEPDPARQAFEAYLTPGSSRNAGGRSTAAGSRQSQLQYLTAPLLSHPNESDDVSFFDRSSHYVGNQPSSELAAGGVSIGQFLNEFESFVTGSTGSGTPVGSLRVLLVAGNETLTRHLQEVLLFALNAATEYKRAQSANGGTEDPNPPQDYDGEPLEVLVEREAVTTALADDERPGARDRAEAGQQFLRFLAESGYTDDDGAFTAADFAGQGAADGSRFVLSDPEQPVPASDRRYNMVTAGRALDGHEVYRALVNAVPGIEHGNPSWPNSDADLPVPQDESVTSSYETGAEQFVAWYSDLYDEPSGDAGDAWYPDRMEYRFQVATGPKDSETVFSSAEYPGGGLDWYSFSHESGASLDPPADSELTTTGSKRVVPTPARYPGMPVPRWWEFEDAAVHLDDIPAGPEDLSKLLLLDFSLVHSNDWYVVPMETPVGTLTRFTDVTVTDSFGETETLDGVDDSDWNTFMYHGLDAAEDGEPGMLLPPTLGDTQTSEPVEQVYFSRDEMANMAFGVEERVESYVGDPLEREEFHEPTVEIQQLVAGKAVDVEDERVVLHNPGDAPLDLDGWELESTVVEANSTQQSILYDFGADHAGDVEVPPGESVTVYTGVEPPGDVSDASEVYVGKSSAVWTADRGSVAVLRPEDEYSDVPEAKRRDARFVTKEPVTSPEPSLPDYQLASSVPDHWFPLKPVRPRTGDEADPADPETYQLALALLLDADSMDDPLDRIPTPNGRLLKTPEPLRIREEEVMRSGREIERHYQVARWTDGSTWMWSSREASTGRGEAASQLAYDQLDEGSADTASETED